MLALGKECDYGLAVDLEGGDNADDGSYLLIETGLQIYKGK